MARKFILTIIGALKIINDIFAPKRFATNPNTIFEIVAPIESNEVAQDASCMIANKRKH